MNGTPETDSDEQARKRAEAAQKLRDLAATAIEKIDTAEVEAIAELAKAAPAKSTEELKQFHDSSLDAAEEE